VTANDRSLVATDKFAHELEPGDVYAPLRIVIDSQLNEQFIFATETFGPRYVADGSATPIPVCPALLLQLCANTRSPSFRLAPGTGSVLAEATTRFLGRAFVGDALRIDWRVLSAYEKRSRRYYVMEAVLSNEASGISIIQRELHLTFPGHANAHHTSNPDRR
jgi:hypothetical protein